MEPPSPDLLHALQSLGLASARDLRRAARRCRRLAIDLPTFDTVWLDALVSLGRLTRFQATLLEAGRAAELEFGPYTLVDRIAERTDAETFLARKADDRTLVVLKTLPQRVVSDPALIKALSELTKKTLQRDFRYAILPHEVVASKNGDVGLISRYVEGRNARQELIRYGRFPGETVLGIAAQLLSGLEEIHAAGFTHGDICLKNIRLNPRGNAVLVDGVLREALSSSRSVHELRSVEEAIGLAPEQIGVGALPSKASDVYSLGCALWQMLAGRPPFASGDALTVLTAHRTKELPEVRDYAPETPDELAQVIMRITARNPALRMADLKELQRVLRPKRLIRTAGLQRPSRTADQPARFSWVQATAATVLIGASAAWMYQEDLARGVQAANEVRTNGSGLTDRQATMRQSQLAELPPPDAAGVLKLEHAGPYAATEIILRGPLALRGNPDRPATIVIQDEPLFLSADEVSLKHVNLVFDQTADGVRPPALALIESQNLVAQSCRFECRSSNGSSVGKPPAIAWRMIDRADPTAGEVLLQNCLGSGARELIYAADTPRTLSIDNVLCVEAHRLVSVKALQRPTRMKLDRVTVRDVQNVVAIGGGSPSQAIEVAATSCLFDLLSGGSLHAPSESPVVWRGSGVVASRRCWETLSNSGSPEDANGAGQISSNIEGILPAEISFAGPAGNSNEASAAKVTGVPRRSGQEFGADLSKLPAPLIEVQTSR